MQNSQEIKEKISLKYLLLLMGLAYTFSFAIRMIWVYQFQGNDQFLWNGQLMINTNDGYTWAAGAQNILMGYMKITQEYVICGLMELYSLQYYL